MNQAYFETLPKDYFGNLYQKVSNSLTKGENVCISIIPGFGEKTIFNFLNCNFKRDKLFNKINVYDPGLENDSIINFYKNLESGRASENKLLIIRFFEQIEDKNNILEKLDGLRRKNPKLLTFLAISNQEAYLYPSTHQAITTVFFSDLIYFQPFDLVQTEKMIKSLKTYYGWNIDTTQYRNIYSLSGGIPRIIKYLTKEFYESRIPLSNKDKLILIPQISFQLKLMTKILISHNEKQLFLLDLTDEGNKIRSSLLKHYIKNYRSEIISNLYPQLGALETKILSFFSENEGKIITLDNLATLMKMTDDNFSLWAIYKLISRLKPKIKNNYKINNIKGRGYILQKINL